MSDYWERLEKLADRRVDAEYRVIELQGEARRVALALSVAEAKLERLDKEFYELANSETAPTGIEAASKQKQTV